MASPIAELLVSVGADVSRAVDGLNTVNGKIGDFSTASKAALPASTALAGVGVAVGAGFASAVTAAADFEKQMSGVKAVMAPGDVAQFGAALSDLALKLGKDTTFTAREAAAGIEELVKAGISAEAVLRGAGKSALDLAAATGISVADAAEVASQAMNAFGVSVERLPTIVDFLAGTANASAAGMGDLRLGLQQAGAVAATVGLSFQDTATALGLMANNGIKGSDAGTSLKTMLLGLIPATKSEVNEFKRLGLFAIDDATALAKLHNMLANTAGGMDAMKTAFKDGNVTAEELFKIASKLGVVKEDTLAKWAQHAGLASNAFFDAQGKVKSLADVAGILQKALAGQTEEQRLASLQTLFGTDAMRAAAIISKEGAAGVSALTGEISKITAAESAATRLNNLSGAMAQLGGSVETLQITMGQRLLPVLRFLADSATGLVNAFIGLPEPVQTAIAVGVGLLGVVVGLLGAFGLLAFAVTTLLPAFAALGTVGAAVIGFLGAFLVPILAIGAAVGLLAVAWANDWGGIREIAEQVGTALVGFWTSTLLPAIEALATTFTTTVLPALAQFAGFVRENVFPLLAALVDLYLAAAQLEIAAFGAAWNALQPILAAVGGWLQTFIIEPIGRVLALIGELTGIGGVLGGIASAVGTTLGGIVTNAPGALQAATADINAAAASARGVATNGVTVNGPLVQTGPIQNEADEQRLAATLAGVLARAEDRVSTPIASGLAGAYAP